MNKKLFVVSICMALIMLPTSCSKAGKPNANDNTNNGLMTENDTCFLTEDDSITNGQSLNDIRFANFKDKDWIDNDYIRALRKHIDDYKSGKIKDGKLNKYKDDIQGKFVIDHTEPFLLDGLYIEFIFVDRPENVFSVWVYSSVNEQTEKIVDYSVSDIKLEDKRSGFTSKKQILDLLKEHPEYKMW